MKWEKGRREATVRRKKEDMGDAEGGGSGCGVGGSRIP